MDIFCCRKKRERDTKKKGGKKNIQIPGCLATNMIIEVEKKCNAIIEDARNRREDRLDTAKKEAESEVQEERKKREAHHKSILDKLEAEEKEFKKEIDKETKEKLAAINKQVNREKSKVVGMIVRKVCEVKPTPHRNLHYMGRQNSHSSMSSRRSLQSQSQRSKHSK